RHSAAIVHQVEGHVFGSTGESVLRGTRNAQRSRMTPSRAGPSPQGILCGAPARTSRSIGTEPALSCRNDLSVRHFASDRVPSDLRRLTRSASAQRHIVALAYTLSRDTTTNCPAIRN